ncbi:hypothetical protein OIU91_04555 [Streptomyces sp. NBC_01456]|uniref:hypothetical protein n=1 Tax=unclassified Streptomyces TaxID=2593676 RepID=UPI002E365425|nr:MULTISPECIES: hypothetical protein [unclassified Streptomyces]
MRRTIRSVSGYEIQHRADPLISYGFVWEHISGSNWVAEYLPTLCNGGGIPGFASRKMAAYFVYRYNKPEPSGRKD